MNWHTIRQFLLIAALLGVVAVAAQSPASSDRDAYEKVGRHLVVPDCRDVHCFRVLVAGVLEHLPGPSLFKWKLYAVLANAGAALAIGRLSIVLGLSTRTALFATWLAALGFGPMHSVYDPYTSDPLMYLLGPLIVIDLLRDRRLRPGLMASVGVFAKEFAAAPLWIFTLFLALQRRWEAATRTLLVSTTATLIWLALQTSLIALYNYSYGGNPSVNLAGGGYLTVWISTLGRGWAALYLFVAFGPLFILLPFGLMRAGATLRLLAIAALPALAVFLYVQQPDRALWNFHFIVIPMAVLALDALPTWMCWLFVVCFGGANLRLGVASPFLQMAQPGWLAISVALALAAGVAVVKRRPLTGPPNTAV